jgi:hypothetical protein
MKPTKITVFPKPSTRVFKSPARAFKVSPLRAWRRQVKALLLVPNCESVHVEFSSGPDQLFFA